MFVGASFSARLSSPPIMSSVRRVIATGAMQFTRTPNRSSSRERTIVSAAMPALADA